MKRVFLLMILSVFMSYGIAQSSIVAPQPASCISSGFTSTGNSHWQTVSLKLTNNCAKPVDFQNATITFSNGSNLNAPFWGNFAPLSYPINALQITSNVQETGYLSSFSLQFPTYSGANSKLPDGESFTIIYGAATADYVADSVSVYLNAKVGTGSIKLTNSTAQPDNVEQPYALVNLTVNDQEISQVQLPWSGQQVVSGLAPGNYALSPVTVKDNSGRAYQGVANPANVTVIKGTTASSIIAYTTAQLTGKINIALQALPDELSGYVENPSLTLTRDDNNSAADTVVNWNSTTEVDNLASGKSYRFSTTVITYNGYNCTPFFSPASVIASSSAPTVNLTYVCSQVVQDNVSINITGAPGSASSITVSFKPDGSSAPVTETVSLTNGSGTASVQLNDGTIYTVSADAFNGYAVSYSPQPLTVSDGGTETITYTVESGNNGNGRLIAYLPGWKTPPPVSAIANAGYTHVLIAFGVFSTTDPGKITSAFDTVSANYINALQNAGIKVLLSLGGASSSIPNTTVNFHDVFTLASSEDVFKQTFVNSLENLVAHYGFDGFDFDIEHGLNAGGSFSNPSGDIEMLASIINTMHAKHPNLSLTMAPQIANMAATAYFTSTWGNYAALVMQTHQSLEWVGIQMYNSGCAYGIDLICYDPKNTSSPDASVAMATDLLANWPATTASGQPTYFQPYTSYLKPSQVVLGYLAPNSSGRVDGSPAAVTSTIKRAIQCLRTGIASATGCDTYIPPEAYPGIGGVFEWEITFDQSNNYRFATDLRDCVKHGGCD